MAQDIDQQQIDSYEGFPYTTFIEQVIRKELAKKATPESRIRPMTAWIRVTSGVQQVDKPNAGFISMEGILKTNNEKQASFRFNDVYNSDSYRFRPGITELKVDYKSKYGGVRVAKITWQLNSKEQLNEYGPYFLTPGRSILIEWGWLQDGDLFALQKDDFDKLNAFKNNQWQLFYNKALLSGGNYDGCLGIITNFDIVLRDDGGYDCTTDVTNQGALMYGLNLVHQLELKPVKVYQSPSQFNFTTGKIEPYNPKPGDTEKNQTAEVNSLEKEKYKRDIKQFIDNDINRIVLQYANLGESGRPRDVHVFSEGVETIRYVQYQNQYVQNTTITEKTDLKNVKELDENGRAKTFVTWGFIEDVIINAHLGAKFSNEGGGQIFRISSQETKIEDSKTAQEKQAINRSFRTELNGQSWQQFYRTNVNSYKISNNKYLRSTDLSVCFINNSGNNAWGILFNSPTIEGSEESKDYVGYVRHIYVNLNHVIQAFETADSLTDALTTILNLINSAHIQFWNLKLKIKERTQEMCVIDENYFDEKMLDAVKDAGGEKLYLIKAYGGQGFLKSIDFSTKLPDSVKVTSLYGMNSNEDDPVKLNTDNDSFINLWNDNKYKDFFLQTEYKPPTISVGSNNSDDSNPSATIDVNAAEPLYWDAESPNRGFSIEMRRALLPSVYWKKQANENDLVVAMKKLVYSQGENNSKQEIVLPAELSFTIEGISGLRIGDIFLIDAVPDMYKKNSVFQISGVDQTVGENYWTTSVRAMLRIFDLGAKNSKMTGTTGVTGTEVANLQQKRYTGSPKKEILKWIKDNMGNILVAKAAGKIYSDAVLAGIMYAEASGEIDTSKDAKTNCENIFNPDGKGYSYSFFQINDKANGEDINTRLDAGEWKSPQGAASLAQTILDGKVRHLQSIGVSGDELLAGTIAAYNVGEGTVGKLFREGLPVDNKNAYYVSKVLTAAEEYEKI
jgi:hypothetical protein